MLLTSYVPRETREKAMNIPALQERMCCSRLRERQHTLYYTQFTRPNHNNEITYVLDSDLHQLCREPAKFNRKLGIVAVFALGSLV